MQSFIDNILKAEMVAYLGYLKHEKADKPNKRNGYSKKTVRSDSDTFELSTPRDSDFSLSLYSSVSIKPVLVGLMTW